MLGGVSVGDQGPTDNTWFSYSLLINLPETEIKIKETDKDGLMKPWFQKKNPEQSVLDE